VERNDDAGAVHPQLVRDIGDHQCLIVQSHPAYRGALFIQTTMTRATMAVSPQRDQSRRVKALLHCYAHTRTHRKRERERDKERKRGSVIVSSGENHHILQSIGSPQGYSVENRRDLSLAG